MIARIWAGRTGSSNAEEYLAFLTRVAIPDYRSVEGCLAAYVLHRVDEDIAHFQTLTFWSSEGAISMFAGKDFLRAKYYPEDEDFLLDFPEFVQHFKVDGNVPAGAV